MRFQFLSEAFGFPTDAVRCKRTRKLVDVFAKATKAKNQAPMFTVETMDYLEQVVTEANLPKGYRLAAGKLRLCIQASLRWDDLARTHFANVEWIRRKGREQDHRPSFKIRRVKDGATPLGCIVPGSDT